MLTSACTSTSSGREPSTQHSTADPGALAGRSARNSCDGFGTALQARAGHLEHAQLADRAEPVLHRADDTVRVVLLALEIQHRVDDVLERLGSGEVAVLGDVADEERRDVLSLGGKQQLRRRLAHLPDAAGRRLELEREHRLDRVDDHERRPEPGDLFEDPLEAGLGEDVERRALDAEALAARLDLVLGFFARAVEHRPDGLREVRRRLQQQRRLADARLAADQHERSRHDAAAEHAIELADAGRQPLGDDGVDVGVELRPARPPASA